VELGDGRLVTAHCPNTGTMATCWREGAPVELSHSPSPTRKLPWTLERVDMGAGWIGVNTARPNQVLAEAIAAGRIPGLAGCRRLRRELAYAPAGLPKGRLDIGLYLDDPPPGSPDGLPDILVEIKNVTLLDGECLRFPDAPSERARKHLDLLVAAVAAGRRGVVLFAANRPEGGRVAPAWGLDPAYGRRLAEAMACGVEALAVRLVHLPGAIVTGESLPVDATPPGGSVGGSVGGAQ
jgi:sugar fermentation stimulation protein A